MFGHTSDSVHVSARQEPAEDPAQDLGLGKKESKGTLSASVQGYGFPEEVDLPAVPQEHFDNNSLHN